MAKVALAKFCIENYFGGEMKDEVLYTDTLEKARQMARGEHSLIIDIQNNTIYD